MSVDCARSVAEFRCKNAVPSALEDREVKSVKRKKTASSLNVAMNAYQVEWRRSNVSSVEWGTWERKRYPWIVPRNLWEEGLWPGIRTGSDKPLPAYLKAAGVQKHRDVHNLKSSWILCAGSSDSSIGPAASAATTTDDRIRESVKSASET